MKLHLYFSIFISKFDFIINFDPTLYDNYRFSHLNLNPVTTTKDD